MKKYLKGLLLMTLTLVCVNFASTKLTVCVFNNVNTAEISNDTIKGNTYEVTATMYYPVASQCDADPLITAGMFKIDPVHASEQKWIAMSRDMIARWGGEFNYGDYVEIKGTDGKDGIYRVVDTMNKRFTNRIDFLESKGTKPYKFENVTLTKVEWKTQTPKENLLANL